MNPELKKISYRGGLVAFQIPAHWREEYAVDGGATFYEDAQDSPTLRLEVITALSPTPLSASSAPDVVAEFSRGYGGVIESLPNGCALVRYTKSGDEQGHQLFVTYWSIAQVLPPSHARIAIFSYTMLDRQRSEVRFQHEVDMLDSEIRASVVSTELAGVEL